METLAEIYQRDGVVCLKGVIDDDRLALLRQGIDANLANLSPRAKIASAEGDPGRFVEDFCCWQDNPFYRQVIFESPLGRIAADLMRSRTARLYHDHMLTKEAGTRQPTPWHQDQPYYNIAGRQNCSFWIPVDPVGADATLRFVKGSHAGAWYMPRSFRDAQAKWFPEGSLADLPDMARPDIIERVVGWPLDPGDAVCFHMLTLHASAGTGPRRRVFSVRVIGDDVTHAPRAWATSPAFPGLETMIPAGAALQGPLFPLLWPRASR